MISVIIPCYNAEKTVQRAVDSILIQTLLPEEIILINSNSIDETWEVLIEIQRQSPCKIIISNELKKGVSAARNKGLSIANGKYIQFLDADDVLLPHKLEKHQTMMEDNPAAVMIACAYIRREANGKEKIVPAIKSGYDMFQSITASYLGHLDSNFFRKESIKAIDNFDESLQVAEDTLLIYNILHRFGSENVLIDEAPSAIYIQSKYGTQLTSINPISRNLDGLKVRKHISKTMAKSYHKEYQNSNAFYIDYIYFFVFRIGIFDIELAIKMFKEELGDTYIPNSKSTVIPKLHILLFRILGFEKMLKTRQFFKNKINSF